MSDTGADKVIYISGRMTGEGNFGYDAFHRAHAGLRERFPDAAIINPAETFGGDQTRDFTEYMAVDIEHLLREVTEVWVLPNWTKSPGATLEVAIACALGLGVHLYPWGDPLAVYLPGPSPRSQLDAVLHDYQSAVRV